MGNRPTNTIRAWLLGALLSTGTALCVSAPASAGSDDMPVKVDFIFRFNVRVGPSAMVPPDLAPWYQWFPYDPNMVSAPAQSTPYPHWPSTFPPVDPSAAGQSQGALPSPSPLQRVGFPPAQVPSYWYGR